MKNIFPFLLITIFSFTNTFAQEDIIATPFSNDFKLMHGADFNPNATTVYADELLTPYVLNVYFTLINDGGNHSSQDNLGVIDTPEQIENKFQDCIMYLNTAYNSSNIFFKYVGYQVVQNQQIATSGWNFTLYTSNPNPTYSTNDMAQYKKTDAMNLIFLDIPPTQTGEFAYMGYNAALYRTALLNSADLAKTVVHKMGHNLSLFHTYETGSHFAETHPLYSFTSCEHVTRDFANPYYNANIAGDELRDTAAQPIVSDANFVNNCGEYIAGSLGNDCYNATPYTGIVNGNHMNSLGTNSDCNPVFTLGQTVRMREFIVNNPTVAWNTNMTINYFQGVIANTRNTVASLYQPYERIQVISPYPNVLSTTDNGNGTALVCRSYTERFKFQKGFDYQFPNNQSPDFTAYSTNQLPFISLPPFNCPVTILQLAPGQTNLTSNSAEIETVCRGKVCVDEPIIGGTIISTIILGSMNITVEQLTNAEVNDPELFNNLMSHYYYILKKETESGAKTEQIFYKQ